MALWIICYAQTNSFFLTLPEPSFAGKAMAGERYSFRDFDVFDKYYFFYVGEISCG